MSRGVNQAVTGKLAGADLSSSQGTMNTIRGMAAKAGGINQGNAIRALRELLLSR